MGAGYSHFLSRWGDYRNVKMGIFDLVQWEGWFVFCKGIELD